MARMKGVKSKTAKERSSHIESHSDNAIHGMGDNYGTGVRAPIGNLRGDTVGYHKLSKKKLHTPPMSVV